MALKNSKIGEKGVVAFGEYLWYYFVIPEIPIKEVRP